MTDYVAVTLAAVCQLVGLADCRRAAGSNPPVQLNTNYYNQRAFAGRGVWHTGGRSSVCNAKFRIERISLAVLTIRKICVKISKYSLITRAIKAFW